MRKLLITGISGFVSSYLLDYFSSKDEYFDIVGICRDDVKPINYPNLNIKIFKGDLIDAEFVKNVIKDTKPDYIIHLAAYSSVAYSWKFPVESFRNNTNIFLNVIESVRLLNYPTKILSIGSSEEYGIVKEKDLPIKETLTPKPINPYAIARVSQEMLGKLYARDYNLDIVMTRSFNHFGPKQRADFVTSSFAKQIVEKKKSNPSEPIKVGDLSIIRDFLDVRDVVKAYALLLEKGQKGEVYNVCSGRGLTLAKLMKTMGDLYGVPIKFEVEKEKLRPNDNPFIIGDNTKLMNTTGWKQEISLEQSLNDILKHWEQELENS